MTRAIYRGGFKRLTPEQEAELIRRFVAGEKPSVAARAMGLNPDTGRARFRDFVRGRASLPAAKAEAAPPSIAPPSIAMERENVRLKDKVAALEKRVKDLHRQELNDDAIREILTGMARHETAPPDWLTAPAPRGQGGGKEITPQVPVIIWSDWHIGEVVSAEETHGVNAYDIAIAKRRLDTLIANTLAICRDHGPKAYAGAVVPLLGDFVSGGLHPELLATDEQEVIPSALTAADMLTAGLRRLADVFGRLYVPAVCGNHGRATRKPEFKRYVVKNFDFLIYEMVRKNLAGDSRIVIDHRSENDVHFRIFTMRFAATHGDMLGVKGGDGIIGAMGPIMRGEIKTGKQMAAIGRDYDMLLMGHWHQMLWLPRAIVANSMKGWDEYARLALRAPPSRPTQPLFFVHPTRGITSQWEVQAEPRTEKAGAAEWVSWKAA